MAGMSTKQDGARFSIERCNMERKPIAIRCTIHTGEHLEQGDCLMVVKAVKGKGL